MIANEFKPKQALLLSRMIYFGLIGGLLFFLVVAFFITTEKLYFKTDLTNPFLITLLVLSLTSLPIGSFISERALPNPDANEKLPIKFPMYQTRLIIRMATCEGVGLFSVVCFLLTPNLVFLLVLLIPLFIMLQYYPTPEKIGRDLNLTQSEIDSFSGY